MLVLGDAHADEPENRRALLAAYEAYAGDDDPADSSGDEGDDDRGDATVALQVGDLGYYDPPAPTWFVAGNNEDFDVIESLRRRDRTLVEPRLHLLASDVADVGGLRVAGLSGNYAPTQYDKPRSELMGERRRHFVRADVERAADLDDVDVLLVHQAPHGLLRIGGRDPGCAAIDDLVAALSPRLCLVGHYHRHVEASIDGTRTVALAPVWKSYYALDPASLSLERRPTPEPDP